MSIEIKSDRMMQLFARLAQVKGDDFKMPAPSSSTNGIASDLMGHASRALENPTVRSGVSNLVSNLFRNEGPESNLLSNPKVQSEVSKPASNLLRPTEANPDLDAAGSKGLSSDQKKTMCVDALTNLEIGFGRLQQYVHTVEANHGVITDVKDLLAIVDSLEMEIAVILNQCGDVLPEETMERVRGMRDQLKNTRGQLEGNNFQELQNFAENAAAALGNLAAGALAVVGGAISFLSGFGRLSPQP